MKTKSAKAKGRILEQWIVERLHQSGLDIRAQRNPGSGSGKFKGDIWNDLNICFECKNTAKPNLGPALKQAQRESLGTQTPVLVWHPPQEPMENSVAILPWWFLEDLLLKVKNSTPQAQNPDRQLAYKLRSLRRIAQDVINEIPQ